MLWHEAYDKAYLDINVEIHKYRPVFLQKMIKIWASIIESVVLDGKFHILWILEASKMAKNTRTIGLWHKNRLISTLELTFRCTVLFLYRKW